MRFVGGKIEKPLRNRRSTLLSRARQQAVAAVLSCLLSLFCSGAMALQLLGADNKPAISVEEIQELRHKIAEQQKQIEQLQKAVADQQALLDSALKAMPANSRSAAPVARTGEPA